MDQTKNKTVLSPLKCLLVVVSIGILIFAGRNIVGFCRILWWQRIPKNNRSLFDAERMELLAAASSVAIDTEKPTTVRV